MSEDFIKEVNNYIHQVISGFESGIYKTINQNQPDKLKYLASKHQPFITIFRDLHEEYYTKTFNSIVNRNDKYVIDTFDGFQKKSNHSKQCLLNILANLVVSIHFNIDRNKLQYNNYDTYMKSLHRIVNETITVINMEKLFSHECNRSVDENLKPLTNGEKFIKIDLSFKSNGINKKINSFTDEPSENNK
ncbi:putative ORFan [Tupanvirus deep ocean]|uniref:ORFan n=2 Tax=Tupanvirus TaxID=2094720 RepID=A0AC62AA03_9VIRU|nr:putative ORFan [Tupanvirus deep ocean]QKU34606.1 putative ORFan [Tupanvirus deep ocean]